MSNLILLVSFWTCYECFITFTLIRCRLESKWFIPSSDSLIGNSMNREVRLEERVTFERFLRKLYLSFLLSIQYKDLIYTLVSNYITNSVLILISYSRLDWSSELVITSSIKAGSFKEYCFIEARFFSRSYSQFSYVLKF